MSHEANQPNPSDARLKHGKRLTEAEKRAIVAAVSVKGSMQLVAQEFGIHRNTVSELCKGVREISGSVLSPSWKADLTKKAVVAVSAGLDCDADPYKRGTLGTTVLTGLGEFKSGVDINVGVQVQTLPPDMLERYIRTPTVTSDDDT